MSQNVVGQRERSKCDVEGVVCYCVFIVIICGLRQKQRPLSPPRAPKETYDTVRVVLPFKDQISADIVKEKLKDLSLKVNTTIQPVFPSRKIKN